ncbi:MAG: type II toxin-antitoxin system VapC family toxin [Herpetosiphonaceae bacterium]|nr:type II toxin-antitoxin system VapC family toxin [Herpetosiphonaceae bacterium]
MHLLDTDTLTHLWAGNERVAQRLQMVADPDVATTVVTKAEVLRGRIDFLLKAATGPEVVRAQQLFTRTEDAFAQILVIAFDSGAAEHFERLRATKGLAKVGRADLLIASIALAQRAIIVTRNLRHFRQIPGVTSINWVD